jgi:hypothetical protein
VGVLLVLWAAAAGAGRALPENMGRHRRALYAGVIALGAVLFDWAAGGQTFTLYKLVVPARLGWAVASICVLAAWLYRPTLFLARSRWLRWSLVALTAAVGLSSVLFGNSVIDYTGKYNHEGSLALILYGLGLIWLLLVVSSYSTGTWKRPAMIAVIGATVWLGATASMTALSHKSRFLVGTISEATRSLHSWNRGVARLPPLSVLPWSTQYAGVHSLPRSSLQRVPDTYYLLDGRVIPKSRSVSCTSTGEARARSALLITLDALRYDLFGLVPKVDLPNYKRLMDRSLVFEQAMQVNAGTMGSITSIHTGRYLTAITPTLDLWPDVASSLDMLEISYASTPGLLHQGHEAETPMGEFTDQILDQLRRAQREEKPFLLHAHYWSLHRPGPDKSKPWLQRVLSRMVSTDHDYQKLMKQMDGEIGRLLDFLDESGLGAETLLILSADHGEELKHERGFVSHAFGVTDSVIHTPLLVSGPSITPGTPSALVSGIDITPTVVDALGLSCEMEFHGASLLGPLPARSAVFASSASPCQGLMDRSFVISDRHMVLSPPWKLVFDRTNHGLALYDLSNDPHERQNLADEHPDVTEHIADGLNLYLSGEITKALQIFETTESPLM